MDDVVRTLSWKRLQENKVVDSRMMVDRRTDEIVGSEVDYTRWKKELKYL